MSKFFSTHMSREQIDISTTGVQLEAYRFRGVAIIAVVERALTSAHDVHQFPHQIFEAMGNFGDKVAVLDFEAVENVSSVLLGALVSLNKKLASQGGELRLARLNQTVTQLLSTTKLDRILMTFDAIEGAAAGRKKKGWWPFGSR